MRDLQKLYFTIEMKKTKKPCGCTRKNSKKQKSTIAKRGKAIMDEAKKVLKANPLLKWKDAVAIAGKTHKAPAKNRILKAWDCITK